MGVLNVVVALSCAHLHLSPTSPRVSLTLTLTLTLHLSPTKPPSTPPISHCPQLQLSEEKKEAFRLIRERKAMDAYRERARMALRAKEGDADAAFLVSRMHYLSTRPYYVSRWVGGLWYMERYVGMTKRYFYSLTDV